MLNGNWWFATANDVCLLPLETIRREASPTAATAMVPGSIQLRFSADKRDEPATGPRFSATLIGSRVILSRNSQQLRSGGNDVSNRHNSSAGDARDCFRAFFSGCLRAVYSYEWAGDSVSGRRRNPGSPDSAVQFIAYRPAATTCVVGGRRSASSTS